MAAVVPSFGVSPVSRPPALAKCLSFIDGNEVWFEPYNYAYLTATAHKRATNSILPMGYDGNEDLYEKAAERLSGFMMFKLEPDRLS